MREIKYPYVRLESQGVMLPVVEAHCDYKQPAKYDDLLKLTIRLSEIKGCRMRIEYEVFNEEDMLLCKGYTTHAFMCSANRRPTRPPEAFVKCIEKWRNPHG